MLLTNFINNEIKNYNNTNAFYIFFQTAISLLKTYTLNKYWYSTI